MGQGARVASRVLLVKTVPLAWPCTCTPTPLPLRRGGSWSWKSESQDLLGRAELRCVALGREAERGVDPLLRAEVSRAQIFAA